MPIPLPMVELGGSPTRMGESFGESCAVEIRALYALRVRAAIASALERGRALTEAQVLGVCRACLPGTAAYDPIGYAEFAGIARAAGLSPEQLYALQGLTDLRDVLAYGPAPDGEGCSSFIVAGDRAAGGDLLLGQNWDLQTDNHALSREIAVLLSPTTFEIHACRAQAHLGEWVTRAAAGV